MSDRPTFRVGGLTPQLASSVHHPRIKRQPGSTFAKPEMLMDIRGGEDPNNAYTRLYNRDVCVHTYKYLYRHIYIYV